MLVVVAYDIKDDKRRTRLGNLLKSYGDRVQLSVFECPLDPDEFKKLKREVQKLVRATEDSVLYYTLCRKCAQKESRYRIGGRPSQQTTIVF